MPHARTALAVLVCFCVLTGTAAAQPVFEGVATARTSGSFAGGAATSITIPVPPSTVGAAAGDLLIVVMGTKINPSTTSPSGWTKVVGGFNDAICASGDGLGIRCQLSVFYRIADGSESSVSFTYGPNPRQGVGGVLRYSGVDPATPVDPHATQPGTGSTVTAPSATASVADSRILRVAIADAAEAESLFTSTPADSRLNMASTQPFGSGVLATEDALVIAASDAVQAAAGATGTASWSLPASEQYRTLTLPIRPDTTPTIVTLVVTARVAGNTADCFPAKKVRPPICIGDGKGDNHNDQLPAVPKFVSALVNGSSQNGNGSKGHARIHMEFPLGELFGKRIEQATVYLTTHRGTIDKLDTWFYAVDQPGNGALEDSDYESPATLLPGSVMPVPPVATLPVGDSGKHAFDVTAALKDALRRPYKYFAVQGRISERDKAALGSQFARGLEVYSTCSCSSEKEWPRLVVRYLE